VSVALDTDGSLWICAGEVFHLTHGKVSAATLPLVGDFPVRAIMRAADGTLWIGTAGGGAIRVPPNGKPERYAAKIGTSYITGFLQGKNTEVWIATEGGIAVWRNGGIVSFQHIEGAPHQPVLSMAGAEPEGVWIGTSHGLLRLRNGQFVSDPAISALGSHAVRALYSSVDGALWIGTESGLWRWKDDQMAQVPLEEDAGSQAVLSILEDPLGRLWLGGSDRVRLVQRAVVDRILDSRAGAPAQASAHTSHASDVIVPEDFNVLEEAGVELFEGMPSSSAPDAHNGAWYASDAGPVHINGDTREPPRVPPPVVLEQVVVDGRRLVIPQNSPLTLTPSTKTLEIEATPVVLGSHAGLQMRRKLIGFDRNWTAVPVSHEATYTNLPPGEYVYRVEVSWGDWAKGSSVDLHIIQKAHFYQRWWFLVLCTMLTLMAIWLLHRQKLHRVAAQFGAVAEERNRIAREMHDTILQGCIGISFLLDGIASNEQMQRAEDSPRPALHEPSWAALKLARTEIERTIREARAAIWNLRRTQDEARLDRSLRELFDKMTGNLPVPAQFLTSGPSLQLTRDRQWEILMSAREALRNAIHHAGGAKISVSLRYTTNLVRVEITDEGCGISQAPGAARTGGHFGVVGMQERMAKIGGTCSISSAEGTGTTVTLEIPVETLEQRGTEAK
jgi:signal transduction histidine kinase